MVVRALARAALAASLAVVLAVASAGADAAQASAPQPAAVDARVEVVWPHDVQGRFLPLTPPPPDGPQYVNVRVYLFERGTLRPVPCDFPNRVDIWSESFSHGSRPGAMTRSTAVVDGKTLPVWEANDFLVGSGSESFGAVHFFVTVDGVDSRTNVWTHAVDPRTVLPQRDVYPGSRVASPELPPQAVITIVWPHGPGGEPAPVDRAPLVNVQAQLRSDRRGAEAFDWDRPVRLWRALDNGFLEAVAVGQKRRAPASPRFVAPSIPDGPVWEFNDVDVSAAARPGSHYSFLVTADGLTTYPTVWVHGADARTYLPQPDVPTASGANCPAP